MWLRLQTVSSLERCPLFRVSFMERFRCMQGSLTLAVQHFYYKWIVVSMSSVRVLHITLRPKYVRMHSRQVHIHMHICTYVHTDIQVYVRMYIHTVCTVLRDDITLLVTSLKASISVIGLKLVFSFMQGISYTCVGVAEDNYVGITNCARRNWPWSCESAGLRWFLLSLLCVIWSLH